MKRWIELTKIDNTKAWINMDLALEITQVHAVKETTGEIPFDGKVERIKITLLAYGTYILKVNETPEEILALVNNVPATV